MHILSPVVSFLLHPRTHRLSHSLVISFASCSDNRVSCINYWLSSTPEQERESRYLPVPPACRYRPLHGTASSTPGTNVHGSLKTGLLSAWPSMAQTTFRKQIKERFRGAGKMAWWLRVPQTWLPTWHLTTVSNCGNLICLSAQTYGQAKHPYI